MLDYLKPLSKRPFDVVTFFEGTSKQKIHVEVNTYNNGGEPIGTTPVGNLYDIILVQDHAEDPDKFDHFDHWEAILACPLTYISQLIPQGWYGVIARKTTTSDIFVQSTLDNLKKLL
jgi:hypothetical protein